MVTVFKYKHLKHLNIYFLFTGSFNQSLIVLNFVWTICKKYRIYIVVSLNLFKILRTFKISNYDKIN